MSASLDELTLRMRADSRHWFPRLHSSEASDVPLHMHYTLGLIGEAGEVANVVKKINRDGAMAVDGLAPELADVLIYLLLLADEMGIDLAEAYRDKRAQNVGRWGDPDAPLAVTV
jgi:phosphoribosyl-ATP pyrophosphohydrolase